MDEVVGGVWEAAGAQVETVPEWTSGVPATGRTYGDVAVAGEHDVHLAVGEAASRTSPASRTGLAALAASAGDRHQVVVA